MSDCLTCEFAERDKHGIFQRMCDGFGNCSYQKYTGTVEKTPIEQMQEMLNGAVMSKFINTDACKNYRKGIEDCIKILEQWEDSEIDYV
jgi:uncharacterized cysteine cluster protein YcgN (CxxCxxCC family)